MAQEPKRRHSKARKRTRRASIKLEAVGLIFCPKCNQLTQPHQVCKNCGYYKGEAVKQNPKVEITKA